MLQKSLAIILAVLLFAPLNSGAAAWMSMSMADSNAAITAMGVDEHTRPDHHAGAASSGNHHLSHSMHGGLTMSTMSTVKRTAKNTACLAAITVPVSQSSPANPGVTARSGYWLLPQQGLRQHIQSCYSDRQSAPSGSVRHSLTTD